MRSIRVKREDNPKRPGSRTWLRYHVYKVSKTEKDFIDMCEKLKLGTRAEILNDLRYDSKQGFIELQDQPLAE